MKILRLLVLLLCGILLSFSLLFGGCAGINTVQGTTHSITIEWNEGIAIDYVLPVEMPDPNTLNKITDDSGSLPIGNFCVCYAWIVGHENESQDWYAYVFHSYGHNLLALYHRHVIPAGGYIETFWMYEETDIPKICTKEAQEVFLTDWCG